MTVAVRRISRSGVAPGQLTLEGIEPAPSASDHVFFAIHPTAPVTERVTQLALQWRAEHRIQGNVFDADRFHVTLLPFGNYAGLPLDVIDMASRAIAAITVPPFDVSFDRIANFGQGIVVLRGSKDAPALIALRQKLVTAAWKAGYKGDVQRGYTPHMTLMYGDKVTPEQLIEPVTWTVREVVLVHSLQGQHVHRILKRWPLQS